MKSSLLAILLFFSIAGAQTYNGSTIGKTDYATSLTFSHTVSSNSDRVLYVIVGMYYTGFCDDSAVTYDGVAMTRISTEQGNFTGTLSVWRLDNPSTGAHNVRVDPDHTTSNDAVMIACAIDFYGSVHRSAVDASGFSTAPSVSSISSATNDIVVDGMFWVPDPVETAHGSGQTQRQLDSIGTTVTTHLCVSTKTSSGASETVSNTTQYNVDWKIAGISVGPSAAAATVRKRVFSE